jgi:2-methylcitrate dehydratase
MQMALLAKEGMTGPLSLFEGPKGYKEIYGMTLEYDWTREDLSLIDRCSLKAFNSEVHTQSALEAIRELMAEHRLDVGEIEKIDITTFLTCYHIVGGGAYGDRKTVHSKEQADHSLPYLAAVLLLDGEVYPEQLTPSRIGANDVQTLLSKVQVHTKSPIHKPLVVAGLLDPYTQAYPEKLACEVSLVFRDGKRLSKHKEDYHGYYTRPFTWEDTAGKFRKLTGAYLSGEQQERIIDICGDMENRDTRQLMTVMQEGYIARAAKTPDKH